MYNKNTPVTVEYGRIPQGTLDIAKYLRTDPEKTLFYHSTSFDPNDESSRARWAINRGNFLYAQILALTPDTADGTPLSGLCHYDQGLIDYYASVGLLNRNNLLQVGPANKTGWPYNSIQHMLLEQLRTDANLRSRLRGFTLVSSYIGREDMEIADIIGGNVLMEPSAQEPFNSKFYYRRLLEGANIFVMAPGVCATGAANVESALDELRGKLDAVLLGVSSASRASVPAVKVWVKMENQTAGTGTFPFEDVFSDADAPKRIHDELVAMASQIFDLTYIENEMRFVIECDTGCIPGEKTVGEFNVQAVIANGRVTMTGSAICVAGEDGSFIGNNIQDTLEYSVMEHAAEQAVIPAFCELSRAGYRGYMTNDVVITQNEDTGAYRGWIIDPNARFAAATSIVRTSQKVESEIGCAVMGTLYSCSIPSARGGWLEATRHLCQGNMVRSKDDHLLGLLPVLVADVNPIGNDLWYSTMLSLSTSYDHAHKMFEDFKKAAWELRQAR